MLNWLGGIAVGVVAIFFLWFLKTAINQSKNFETFKKKKRRGYY